MEAMAAPTKWHYGDNALNSRDIVTADIKCTVTAMPVPVSV
jgi:hypothetical protein